MKTFTELRDAMDDVPHVRPPLALTVLAALLWLQTAALTAVTAWLLIELVTGQAGSMAGGLALVVLAAVAAAWLGVTAFATLRRRSWIRGSAFTWQALQIAIAVGFFQGADARPGLAWTLLVPALLGIALVLTPAVVRATARVQDDGPEA